MRRVLLHSKISRRQFEKRGRIAQSLGFLLQQIFDRSVAELSVANVALQANILSSLIFA